MICKYCKNEIPDDLHFTFCGYCGERLIRERKKKNEIKVPKPRQLKSGAWNIELRAEGQSITEPTEAACIAKARAIRAGFIETRKKHESLTLKAAIDKFISSRNNVLSPSTIRGYMYIRNNRLADASDKDIYTYDDWQTVINEDAAKFSPKTMKNTWGFICSVLKENGVQPPKVTLPQVVPHELPWLDYKQIKLFLKAIRGSDCEIGALLALHSLRRSEVLAITPQKITDNVIHVQGSRVFDENDKLIEKDTNKNPSSHRDVEIVIPRLSELVKNYTGSPDEPYVICNPNTLWAQINSICKANGLPEVGVHGLRRSFASLAYHLGWSERRTMATGGWSDLTTIHKIYIKLSEADEKKDIKKMQEYYKEDIE